MKTTILFAVVSCLLLFAFAAYAQQQEPSTEELQRQFEYELRKLQSPRQRLQLEANYLASSHRYWTGQGTESFLRNYVLGPRGGDDLLGLTEEQKQRLPFLDHNKIGEWFPQQDWQNIPESVQAEVAYRAAHIPDDFLFEHATEEQKNTFREAMVAVITQSGPIMQREILETLTPEQMLLVRTWEMQAMSEIGIPHPTMFEILDLTEDQKKEMKEIADEMKVEFDRLVIEAASIHFENEASAYKLLEKMSFVSREEFDKSLREAGSPVWTEMTAKNSADLQRQGTKLMVHMQDCMMDILTDEQLDKMQKILDETPDLIKQLIASRRTAREAQEQAPGYTPGPDSWRPGIPLPVEFKEQRRTGRFPRSE